MTHTARRMAYNGFHRRAIEDFSPSFQAVKSTFSADAFVALQKCGPGVGGVFGDKETINARRLKKGSPRRFNTAPTPAAAEPQTIFISGANFGMFGRKVARGLQPSRPLSSFAIFSA